MYSRHLWVKTIVAKAEADAQLLDSASDWYAVDLNAIGSEELRAKFVQLEYDAETSVFVNNCLRLSDNVFLQLWYSFASIFLQHVMTKTSLNGLLGRGSMFLFSRAHLEHLLAGVLCLNAGSSCGNAMLSPAMSRHCETVLDMDFVSSTPREPHLKLLDIGAGDGKITEQFRFVTRNLFATEVSPIMQWRLRNKGIAVVGLDEWKSSQPNSMANGSGYGDNAGSVSYDIVLLLNVLDRHAKPLSLLSDLRRELLTVNGSVLILALVLPVSQFVEYTANNRPDEALHVVGRSFEEQLQHFVDAVLTPSKFRVLKWTKLPYLCEGDMYRSVYVLYDAVLVLQPLL